MSSYPLLWFTFSMFCFHLPTIFKDGAKQESTQVRPTWAWFDGYNDVYGHRCDIYKQRSLANSPVGHFSGTSTCCVGTSGAGSDSAFLVEHYLLQQSRTEEGATSQTKTVGADSDWGKSLFDNGVVVDNVRRRYSRENH